MFIPKQGHMSVSYVAVRTSQVIISMRLSSLLLSCEHRVTVDSFGAADPEV